MAFVPFSTFRLLQTHVLSPYISRSHLFHRENLNLLLLTLSLTVRVFVYTVPLSRMLTGLQIAHTRVSTLVLVALPRLKP